MKCLTTETPSGYDEDFAKARLTRMHKLELVRIFTDLTDFINKHGLEQIVSIGPSAGPFAKHVAAAYRQRHSKPLRVVNLGKLGEALSLTRSSQPPSSEVLKKVIIKIKGNSNQFRPTLVFDEASNSGRSVAEASEKFNELGLPHKTAVLIHSFPHELGDNRERIDFPPRSQKRSASLAEMVGNSIGMSIRLSDHKKTPSPALAQFIKKLHADLRDVVKRVPKKE